MPFDFSKAAKKALATAQELSRLYHSPVRVLHVVARPNWPAEYSGSGMYVLESLPGILDAAEHLFAEQGLEPTSLRTITAAAEVNLYRRDASNMTGDAAVVCFAESTADVQAIVAVACAAFILTRPLPPHERADAVSVEAD